jgi:hypothetical protein
MAITITSSTVATPANPVTNQIWGSYSTINCTGTTSNYNLQLGKSYIGPVGITTFPVAFNQGLDGSAGYAIKDARGFNRDGIVRNYSGSKESDVNVDSSTATLDTLFFSPQTNGAIKGRVDICAQAFNSGTGAIQASMFRQINFLYSWNAAGTITQRLNASNASSDYTSDATNLPVTKGTLVAAANNVYLRCSRYNTNANIDTYYSIKCFLVDTFETHADLYGFGLFNYSPGHGTGYY